MGVKKRSLNGKGSFATYVARSAFNKNKKIKLERHLRKQPDDAQAAEALKNVAKAKPRKTPVRMKARLDSWVLANDKGEYTHNRSRNRLSGRLSPWGKFTQTAAAFSKAVQNELLNDPKRVLAHHQVPLNLSVVWSGWAEYSANGEKPVNRDKRPSKHKGKPKPKK